MSFPLPALGRLVALALAISGPAHAQWRQLDGPRPPVVGALGIHDGVLVLATDENDQGGTWRSADGGARWEQTGFATGGGAALLSAGGAVYQGTYLGGLWRSSDAGRTWASVPSLAFGTVEALDARGDTLYAATTDGAPSAVARSFDGGQTWTPGGGGAIGRPVAVLARPGGVVLVAMNGNGLFRSPDTGATWAVPAGLPSDAWIGALADDGSAVFALVGAGLTENGLWRSLDEGASWARVGPAVSVGQGGEALLVEGPLVVAATGSGVLRSVDGGQTWATPAGLPSGASFRATDLLRTPGGLLLGTTLGVFRSLDDGATWAPHGAGAVGMSTLGALFAEGGTDGADVLWQGLTEGSLDVRGLWRSGDGGQTWQRRSTGLGEGPLVVGVVRHRGALFALHSGIGRGVSRSDDDGQTWTRTPFTPDPGGAFLALVADGDERLFATLTGRTLYTSDDGGAAWTARPAPVWIRALVRWDGALLAASYGEGVWRSPDDGATWAPFGQGLGAATLATAFAVHDGALVLGTQFGGVYRLDGAVWTPIGPGGMTVDGLGSSAAGLVAAGQDAPGGSGGSVVHLLQGGAWVPLGGGLAETEVSHVSVRGDRLLVAGRQFGLWERLLGTVASEAPPETPAEFSVWPNPAHTGATVRVTGAARAPGLVVFDALGRAVARGGPDGTVRLPVSLAPGVYAVRAGAVVLRLVVVR